jgi:DNA-binding MurR/RpiR family transcriptional regulator
MHLRASPIRRVGAPAKDSDSASPTRSKRYRSLHRAQIVRTPIILRQMTARRKKALDRDARKLPRQSLVDLLQQSLPDLSPVQRQIAEYVLRNYQEVAFMGVAELSRAAGVSPAAIVRFATSLQFDGYPGLQRAVHEIIRSQLRQSDRLAATLDNSSTDDIVERVLGREAENIERLRIGFDRTKMHDASRRLATARAIAIVGFRASATLAQYLWYNLRKVRPETHLFTNPGSVTLEEIALMGRTGTLLVLITFPRYSKELLELGAFGRRQKFTTLGITNNELSPLTPLCDLVLNVEVTEISFTEFYAAPIALMNGLVTNAAAMLHGKALKRLNVFDDLAVEQKYLVPGGRRSSAAEPDKSRSRGTR